MLRAVADDAECMTDIGWTFHRDYAQTVVVNDNDDYLVLSLDVGGFHGDMAAGTRRVQQIAELSFEFEMQCTQHCEFALLTVRVSLSSSVPLSVCLFVHGSLCLSVCLSVCLSAYLLVHMSLYKSVCLCVTEHSCLVFWCV